MEDTQIIAGLDTRLVAKPIIPSYELVLESTHSIPEQHSVVSSQWNLMNSASLASSSSQLAPQMSPSNTTQSWPASCANHSLVWTKHYNTGSSLCCNTVKRCSAKHRARPPSQDVLCDVARRSRYKRKDAREHRQNKTCMGHSMCGMAQQSPHAPSTTTVSASVDPRQ